MHQWARGWKQQGAGQGAVLALFVVFWPAHESCCCAAESKKPDATAPLVCIERVAVDGREIDFSLKGGPPAAVCDAAGFHGCRPERVIVPPGKHRLEFYC